MGHPIYVRVSTYPSVIIRDKAIAKRVQSVFTCKQTHLHILKMPHLSKGI